MWVAIIGAVTGIIGIVFGIFIGLRSKQVFRPVLTFNIGLPYYSANQNDIPKSKELKKATISTLIYCAKIPQNSEVVFACPYLFINNSKLPISNIILQLNYASRYAVDNETVIKGIVGDKEVVVLGVDPKAYKCREVQILDSMAQIRYTIPDLRPGENVVIPDLMKFTTPKHREELDNEEYGVTRRLAKKLREIKKLSDFCVIDVFVYSASCPPLSKRIKLLWFDANSAKELNSLVANAVKVFWGGNFPKPGLYFHFWPLNRKKLIVEEYGEVIVPKLEVVKTAKDGYFSWENPLESKRNIFILKMPPWNYYQLSGNLDTDDLIMMSGFQRVINEEHMEKLPMWNIFQRLRK